MIDWLQVPDAGTAAHVYVKKPFVFTANYSSLPTLEITVGPNIAETKKIDNNLLAPVSTPDATETPAVTPETAPSESPKVTETPEATPSADPSASPEAVPEASPAA